MQRRNILFAFPAALTGLIAALPSAAAQQQESGEQLLLSRLFKIIDQAGTIIPGEGFKSIKIGEPISKLTSLWGKPKSISPNGTLNYQLSSKTLIRFVGDPLIKKIVVQGRPGSLARVNNGAMFGMSRAQVVAQFKKKPSAQSNDSLLYRSLGIELWFKSDQLVEIKVFAP